MSLWRQSSEWMVLVCLGLMPAGGGRCVAADPPLPQAPTARVPVEIEPARKVPPPARQAPAKPAAKKGTLADAIIKAFVGDRDAQQRQAQAAQEQQLRALETENRPQFEHALYIELAFQRRACKPDAKAFVEIAKAAKAELHVPLRKYVVALNSPRPDATADDPRAAVQKMLMPFAERALGQEKARLYRQECDKRMEARKHAAVMNLVAALDERLVLTAAQRAKLVESFAAKYDKSLEQQFEVLGDRYWCLPPIPDESILPLLSREQKRVWQELAKPSADEWSVDEMDSRDVGNESAELQEIAKMAEGVKDGP